MNLIIKKKAIDETYLRSHFHILNKDIIKKFLIYKQNAGPWMRNRIMLGVSNPIRTRGTDPAKHSSCSEHDLEKLSSR